MRQATQDVTVENGLRPFLALDSIPPGLPEETCFWCDELPDKSVTEVITKNSLSIDR